MAQNNKIREAIVQAILDTPCRPINANFPNESASVHTKEHPYMDAFLTNETIDESFMDGGYIKQQLVEVTLYVKKGSDLAKVDEYKDSFQSHFEEGKKFDCFTVFSPPEILSQEETGTAFVVSMVFTLEYYVAG